MESYEPVVDRFLVDRVQYNRDITECRSVATGAMAQAKQRRDAQMAPNILTGLLIRATIGNASGIGSDTRKDSTKQGAVFGALAGAAESGEDVKLGPRRIMDRC
ncbi:MAG: glycine zipper family protein, partial [Marinovum sp.]|nr:glycine zipper family protein [Marinovum sp.]